MGGGVVVVTDSRYCTPLYFSYIVEKPKHTSYHAISYEKFRTVKERWERSRFPPSGFRDIRAAIQKQVVRWLHCEPIPPHCTKKGLVNPLRWPLPTASICRKGISAPVTLVDLHERTAGDVSGAASTDAYGFQGKVCTACAFD